MGIITGISWTDSTHNFWYGCQKVSPGCKFCYAERDMTRYGKDFGMVTRAKGFDKPLSWHEPAKVFVNSWSDFFLPEANGWRDEAWDIIAITPHLTYQILTKRPENIHDMLPFNWGYGYKNVWLGVSVETEKYLSRIDVLADIPAKVRFVSYEPALGPVDFSSHTHWIDWIISGGESGTHPRPADPQWFRNVRDTCLKYNIAYFHKQNGGSKKIDGAWGGSLLDGQVWHQFPDDENREATR